jgi:uncharacterized damage-inducible protein DinB
MTTATLDELMLRYVPAPPRPVALPLLEARDSLRAALTNLSQIEDSALEKEWKWRATASSDVRSGFFRQYEALEDTRARVGSTVAGPSSSSQSAARPLVASASAARWELHGLLAPLTGEQLDQPTGNDEWTVRQTLAHIVNGQRAYFWYTSWWLARADADDFPARVPEEVASEFPAEETDGVGSLDDIRQRLDDVLDLSAGTLGVLSDDQLAARARFAGQPVDVRFRINRWSSHMREHTIQIEKTLGFISRPTTEVDRLLRMVAGAYGRLEEAVFMLTDSPAVDDALRTIGDTCSGVARDAQSVRAASDH